MGPVERMVRPQFLTGDSIALFKYRRWHLNWIAEGQMDFNIARDNAQVEVGIL